MQFIYSSAVENIELERTTVNGKPGWAIVLDPDEGGDVFFEDTATLLDFVARISTLTLDATDELPGDGVQVQD